MSNFYLDVEFRKSQRKVFKASAIDCGDHYEYIVNIDGNDVTYDEQTFNEVFVSVGEISSEAGIKIERDGRIIIRKESKNEKV
jgi:hypothetical protein